MPLIFASAAKNEVDWWKKDEEEESEVSMRNEDDDDELDDCCWVEENEGGIDRSSTTDSGRCFSMKKMETMTEKIYEKMMEDT